MKRFLPYGRHVIDEEDIAAVVSALKGDWLTTGPHVQAFEENLQQACGATHALSCSSGTAALHMAAQALGLRPGSAVIVPALTFLASASAPHMTGADIVFADVEPDSGLLTPNTFLAAIASHTGSPIKAVIPVHLTGRVCDMVAIKTIADQHGIAVIEDACHALGGAYFDGEGRRHVVGACAHSDMSVFSFHPVKTITAGEGGVVTTNDPTLASKLTLARNHGMVRDSQLWQHEDLGFDANAHPNPWYYEMQEPAPNYRMSDINAVLANSQLKKLQDFVLRRNHLVACYDRHLAPLAPVILPPVKQQNVELGQHLYAARIDFPALGLTRRAVMEGLNERGVGSQVHYIPVPWQPYWHQRGWRRDAFPGAAQYYQQTLSLPLFPAMNEDDVERVVAALKAVVAP